MKELGYYDESFNATLQSSDGDLSSYSFHMADQGTDAMEREKQFLFASQEGRYLWHVNEALRRLYGTPGEVRALPPVRRRRSTSSGSTRCRTRGSASPARRRRKMASAAEPRAGAERRVFWTAAVVVVVLDLITKIIAEATLLRTPGISVLGDWFQLRLVYNQGAAFGLHLGPVFPLDLLHRRARRGVRAAPDVAQQPARATRFRQLALGLVAGGAAGNLIDRIRSARGVVDFLDVGSRRAALAHVQRGRHRRELRRDRARDLAVAGGLAAAPGTGVGIGGVTPAALTRSPSSPTTTERLDRFLADQLGLSRTQAARLVADKAVTRGRQVGPRLPDPRPAASGSPSRFPEHEPPRTLRPAAIPLTVVFEDEHLAVHRQARRAGGAPGAGALGRHAGQRAGRPRHDAGRWRGRPARHRPPARSRHVGAHGRRQDRSRAPAPGSGASPRGGSSAPTPRWPGVISTRARR